MTEPAKFIIVDENRRPLTWSERSKQLCYVFVSSRARFYLKAYSKEEASKHIENTITNRKRWKMHKPGDQYQLMKVLF